MHLTDELENIGQHVEAECAHHHIPGLSVVVVHDHAPLWMNSWGFADLEQQIPATTDTIYRICSVTKIFTATMLMQLCEQG